MERTLVLIKPDGVERALIGKVVSKFEDAGMKVIAMKMLKPTKELAGKHYAEDLGWMESVGKKSIASYEARGIKTKEAPVEIGRKIRGYLLAYLTMDPIVAIVLEGNDAIAIVPKLVGSTSPAKADASTLRGTYASDSYQLSDEQKRPIRNIVHVSDSKESAEKEIAVWFKESEIMKYKRADEGVMFYS